MRMSIDTTTIMTMTTSTGMATRATRTRTWTWWCCRWRPRRPRRCSRPSSPRCARSRKPATGDPLPRRARRRAGHYAIDISHPGADFRLTIAKAGAYALFCEHHPAEFGLHLTAAKPAAERKFASHHHQDDISSIGISDPRPLDPTKLNQWLDYLLKTRGQDIFRMKGVLNVKGEDRRQVFHGVHMMFDAQAERPWGQRRA